MANLSTVSAILKEVYAPAIQNELNEEVALYDILKSKGQVIQQVQGQDIKAAFRVRRAGGIGSRKDQETLPTAGSQSYAAPKINYGRTYLRGQITGPTVRDTYTSDAAFENALTAEIEYDIKDLVNDLTRQWHTGDGILTTVNGAVTASTSVVVADVSYLYVGQYVEFWNGATNQSTNDSGQTGTLITAINETTLTVTVTTAQTITSGASVALAGNQPWNASGGTKEMQGLDTIIDDGTDYSGATYFGVDRSNSGSRILQGNRLDFGATTTEDLMQQAVDKARIKGGAKIDAIVTDYTTRRKYANLLLGLKRYPTMGTSVPSYGGGFKQSDNSGTNNSGEGLTFDDVTLVPSRLARSKKMFFLDLSSWAIYVQADVEWIMNGDSILHPLLGAQGLDAYQYSLFYEGQLFCSAPNRNSKGINTY